MAVEPPSSVGPGGSRRRRTGRRHWRWIGASTVVPLRRSLAVALWDAVWREAGAAGDGAAPAAVVGEPAPGMGASSARTMRSGADLVDPLKLRTLCWWLVDKMHGESAPLRAKVGGWPCRRRVEGVVDAVPSEEAMTPARAARCRAALDSRRAPAPPVREVKCATIHSSSPPHDRQSVPGDDLFGAGGSGRG